MFTNPSSARVLELIRESLERDVVPELQTNAAKVTVQMIQQMLVSVERRLPVEQQWMADECNRMARVLQEAGAAAASRDGEAAGALRTIAERAAGAPEFPEVPAFASINESYGELSELLTEALGHLHRLDGEGWEEAPELITRLRAYLQLRINRDMQGIFAMDAGGLLGRG